MVIRIHSPTRAEGKQDWSDVPNPKMISRAQTTALSLKKSRPGQSSGLDQFSICKVWDDAGSNDGPHLWFSKHESYEKELELQEVGSGKYQEGRKLRITIIRWGTYHSIKWIPTV
ncbi:hypothetical protein SAY86_002197 [Trapa natans]|uniref:Uncharacterized protein n=1 Tax=Trapa natans TaxID=22666 RepID=A0AAN7R4I5_TRANT|nr:hypothetical protein SAY86_002197 [Trapa natans]